MNILVIGSGFGGLTAAIRLQAQGHNVIIIEKRDKLGGRAYVYKQNGFIFDGGPTIITAPWLINELFEMCGRTTEDYLRLVSLNPYYNVRFEDGSIFRYNGKRDDILAQIRAFNPADVEGYEQFFAKTDAIFKTGFELIDKPFSKLSDMLKVIPDLVRLQSHRSVAGFVNRYIKDERLRQVFSFHPLLVGGNPFQTTSIYALIHKLEQEWGVWFAQGGTGALVQALSQLFTELGGNICLNTEARRIAINPLTTRASGVHVTTNEGKDEFFPADAIVSNADVASTYLHLIDSRYRTKNTDRRIKRKRYSMSLFVTYFGTDIQYPSMAHHEILMGPRYKGLVTDIFQRLHLSQDFSLYLHRPTATDSSLAPPGCDAWYVLSPVPHLGGKTNWREYAPVYRNAIMRYLEERYLPGLSKHIVTEHSIDPLHFEGTLNSYLGSAFSVEPTLTQSAWFRPHNQSEDIPNLYLVGAGTHPGAGLPGVMSSGKIAARQIAQDIINGKYEGYASR